MGKGRKRNESNKNKVCVKDKLLSTSKVNNQSVLGKDEAENVNTPEIQNKRPFDTKELKDKGLDISEKEDENRSSIQNNHFDVVNEDSSKNENTSAIQNKHFDAVKDISGKEDEKSAIQNRPVDVLDESTTQFSMKDVEDTKETGIVFDNIIDTEIEEFDEKESNNTLKTLSVIARFKILEKKDEKFEYKKNKTISREEKTKCQIKDDLKVKKEVKQNLLRNNILCQKPIQKMKFEEVSEISSTFYNSKISSNVEKIDKNCHEENVQNKEEVEVIKNIDDDSFMYIRFLGISDLKEAFCEIDKIFFIVKKDGENIMTKEAKINKSVQNVSCDILVYFPCKKDLSLEIELFAICKTKTWFGRKYKTTIKKIGETKFTIEEDKMDKYLNTPQLEYLNLSKCKGDDLVDMIKRFLPLGAVSAKSICIAATKFSKDEVKKMGLKMPKTQKEFLLLIRAINTIDTLWYQGKVDIRGESPNDSILWKNRYIRWVGPNLTAHKSYNGPHCSIINIALIESFLHEHKGDKTNHGIVKLLSKKGVVELSFDNDQCCNDFVVKLAQYIDIQEY